MGCCFGKEEEPVTKDSKIINGKSKQIGLDDFDFEKVVGRGSFGKVILVRKKDTGEYFAMKILKKEMLEKRNQRIHTQTERVILEKVKSPFIVKMFYAFQSEEKLYMVMEFLQGGELFFHLHKERLFSESRAVFYAAEIVLALECLHKNGIIYRDLKPENVLLDSDGHIKITDFGLSKDGVTTDSKKTYTFCGTPEYLAPEIIKGVGHDKAVDWWSLGALIFEMLSGRPPFASKNRSQMLKNILSKPVEMRPYFSERAKSIVYDLLCINPLKRLGSSGRDAQEIKEHSFFSSIDWDALAKKLIHPPFKPSVSSKDDYTNFDKQFLRERVEDSPAPLEVLTDGKQEYEDFTYIGTLMASKKNIDI